MIIKFKCKVCGSTEGREESGLLGYEAVICKHCGAAYDHQGIFTISDTHGGQQVYYLNRTARRDLALVSMPIDPRAPEKYKRQIIRAKILLEDIQRRYFLGVYQGGQQARRDQISSRARIRAAAASAGL